MENEFPPNSHLDRESVRKPRQAKTPEKPEVKRITKGKVTIRKKPLYKKFLDAFRPEDNVGFVEYTLLEILVPGIKGAVSDTLHGTVDNAFGTTISSRRGRGGRSVYTSYNRMGGARRERRDEDDRRPSRRSESRVADDAREIIFDTRVEAEEILDQLIELTSMYKVATMRDLLSCVGERPNPTHEDWGWYDLRGARIHRVGGGYLLDLPRPEPLD